MRTTITFDDDVASKLRPLIARENGKSKKVINDLLRKALGLTPKRKVKLAVYNIGLRPEIDPTSLNKLAFEIESEEDIERLRRIQEDAEQLNKK